ncbi:type I-E CRISPR-associated protein Cse1/CasA [Caldimonas thermodepolymerans]|uniref:type I-E CRISPR-associated protein Cse1/CasA n=1 Tax=Caldimonas thermodepolymerans TaxID=215580 RepID=UPI0022365EED|nr:type I-E CRISPR-associated protein Cse1/CasA [Caldimonas thermodepolymerans]UZG43992.1 type I-E CRISPR-associated protein Cse1/CasA [Caldimonas thermodepolymerans]
MHDLLTDELIGVRTPAGERTVNLPMLLAWLAAGQVDGYTGLRAHQTDPWHVFLVQLAASIQARHPTPALPDDPAYWHDGLLDLAEGEATAWSLVVEDVTKPAFLQHPWRGWDEDAADYGGEVKRGVLVLDPKATTPDELDVLVTAKNHDVKKSRIAPQEMDAWLYALTLCQTTSGVFGSGKYGVVRMNGGYGSRPIVAWTPSLHPSRRFADDVQQLVLMRASVQAAHGFRSRGPVLTWIKHWDRSTHQYMLQDLEPWFIEAARPVRLHRAEDGQILALGATSSARQIGPKNLESGDVGDPWIPLNAEDKKKGRSALTLPAGGFTPERLTALLFEQGYELTPLQRPRPGNEPGWFVASVLVRGQGKTEGFHRIELPIPAKARQALLTRERRDTLAHLAQSLLSDATVVAAALRTALTVYAEGGPDKADFDRDAVKAWVSRTSSQFGKRWESLYFPTLWRGAEEDHDRVRQDWCDVLLQLAQSLLDDAHTRLPVPSNRRMRALIQSQSAFIGSLRKKQFPTTSSNAPHRTETEEETTA